MRESKRPPTSRPPPSAPSKSLTITPTMQQSRPRHRPGNLFSAQGTKALRPYGRDAYLPCKTPSSASFFDNLQFATAPPPDQSESSSDTLDDEAKRNTNALLSGKFFAKDLIIQTDISDPPHNSSYYNLYSSNETFGLYGVPPSPTNIRLISEIHHEFADAHNGMYPKVSIFGDDPELEKEKDEDPFKTYDEHNPDRESSDAIDSSPSSSTQEKEVPLAQSPVHLHDEGDDDDEGEEEEEEEEEAIPPLPVQHEHEETRTFSPVANDLADEDADGDDDDDYNMSDSSGKDDDDGSDDDFVDPSYSTFCNQQRRALAQFEKKSSTSSDKTKTMTKTKTKKTESHAPVSKLIISSPAKFPSSSSSPSPVDISTPSSTSSSSSAQKRRARTSGSGSGSISGEDSDSPPPSPSPSKMYTIIREKSGRTSYQCNLCPEVCTKAFGDMKRHLESLKHKTPSHKCDPEIYDFGCGKVFTRNDALKRHMLSQHTIHWALYESENLTLSRKRVKTS